MEEVKPEAKPKRIYSPEALEKLKLARAKADDVKRQKKTISQFAKDEKRNERQNK